MKNDDQCYSTGSFKTFVQDTGGAKIAINPSFSSNPAVMHVNPRFKPSPPPSPKKEPTSIHINPRLVSIQFLDTYKL